jgi:hypothetical protein
MPDLSSMTFANNFEGSFVRTGYGDGIVVAARLEESSSNLNEALKRLSSENSMYQGHSTGELKRISTNLYSALHLAGYILI